MILLFQTYKTKSVDKSTLFYLKIFFENNETNAVARWSSMYNKAIEDRKILDILIKQDRVDAIVKFYTSSNPNLRNILEPLDYKIRWLFLDTFGGSDDFFNFIKNDHTIVERWVKLNAQGKVFSVNHPEKWLYVYDRLYVEFTYGTKLSNATILEHFGPKGLDIVNDVETRALIEYTIAESGNKRRLKVLVSGMIDKSNGKKILKTNWSDIELDTIQKNGLTLYEEYLNNMFPNLKKRVQDVRAYDRNNFYVSTGYDKRRAGNFIGAHAEIQALDELAKQKFPDYKINPPSNEVFDSWLKNDILGYNRNISVNQTSSEVIMPTCVDCFHILDLVTFINKF